MKGQSNSTSRLPDKLFASNQNTKTEEKSLKLKITIFGADNEIVETRALVDSGAEGDFIHPDFVKRLKLKPIPLKKRRRVFNADGSENKSKFIEEYVKITIKTIDDLEEVRLLITEIGKERIILGHPWLKEKNPDINWKTGNILTRI